MTDPRPSFPTLGTLLLAAGSSSRLGRPKQLVQVQGQPLVRQQVERLLRLQPAYACVVTGAFDAEVRAALAGLKLDIVHNPDWQQGMGRSLALGIEAMPERVRGALVLLCDQWKLEDADLLRLCDAWSNDPLAAAVSHWEEASGPPAIFPRALFDRLKQLKGDVGARNVLKRFRGRQVRVPVPNAKLDVDRVEDLP